MMRVLLLLAIISLSLGEDYEEIKEEAIELEKESEETIQNGIRFQLLHTKQCSSPSTNWKCTTGCHTSFTNLTDALPNKCGLPSPSDTCFGQSLNFAYVYNENLFPIEYQVLQNFPRCWSYLAPLICSVHYRPCVKQVVSFRSSDVHNDAIKIANVEMWAKVRRGFCREAYRLCEDVVNAGYFPPSVYCDDVDTVISSSFSNSTSPSGALFSDTCPMPSLPVPFTFKQQCPEPLVFSEAKIKEAKPVFDLCYAKCRSNHFDSHSRIYQNVYQLFFGGVLTVVFVLAWLYLHFFSLSYSKYVILFCAAQSFLCVATWTSLWAVGPLFYRENDCVNVDGLFLRRTEIETQFLHWCVSQSILMNFSLAAGYIWLAVISYLGFVCPKWINENEKWKFGWNVRTVLLFAVYSLSAVSSAFWQCFHLQETDGVSGVCIGGLLSFTHYLPLVILPSLATLWMITSIYQHNRFFLECEAVAIDSARSLIKKKHEYETERRQRFYKLKHPEEEPNEDDLSAITDAELLKAENDKKIEIDYNEPVRNEIDFNESISEQTDGGYVHRMMRRYLQRGYKEKLRKNLDNSIGKSAWINIHDDGVLQYVSTFLKVYARHRLQFYYTFGFYWLMGMTVVGILAVWISLPLHYFFVNSNASYEIQSIKDYIDCALNKSIAEKNTEWIYSNRPQDAFLHCELHSYLNNQRASSVIFVFLILPTTPFLALVAAMVAGFCGRGGMKTVRQTKRNAGETSKKAIRLEGFVEEGTVLIEAKRQPLAEFESAPSFLTAERTDVKEPSPSTRTTEQPGTSRQNKSAVTIPREENFVQSATAPSSRPSVVKEEKTINEPKKAVIGSEDKPEDKEPGIQHNNSSLKGIAIRLRAFIENYGSAAEGMNPMPPVKDMQVLVNDLITAGRRERILNNQHHMAMETLRDLSAFVNYNSERLRADIEMWNRITQSLNQLTNVTSELFPITTSPEGVQERQVNPELARLYEVLLGISQMLTTVNPHLSEFDNWADISNQASTRIRQSVANIAGAARTRQATATADRPYVSIEAPPAQEAAHQQGSSIQRTTVQQAVRVAAENPPEAIEAVPQPAQSAQPQNPPAVVSQSQRQTPPINAQARTAPAIAALPARPSIQGNRAVAVSAQQVRNAPPVAMEPRPTSPNAFPPRGIRVNNQGSAYMETYSAAPSGFFTRFSQQELHVRIQRMTEIHGPNFYPQELIYALIMTGDIRLAGNDNADDGERVVMPSEYPSVFGRGIPIDVTIAPRDFLLAMRRRAIIFVSVLGYDYNSRGRAAAGYMPPTFPDLGFTSMNELLLVRIFGTQNLVRMKQLLNQLLQSPYVRYSPQISEVGGFAQYLDHFATMRGLPHQREEWVPDPIHSPSPSNVPGPSTSRYSAEEVLIEAEPEAEEVDDEEPIRMSPRNRANEPDPTLEDIIDEEEDEEESEDEEDDESDIQMASSEDD